MEWRRQCHIIITLGKGMEIEGGQCSTYHIACACGCLVSATITAAHLLVAGVSVEPVGVGLRLSHAHASHSALL